ncbi:MAG: hypothetical protein V7776_05450 [Halopseudomonas aestusnigri]
MGFAGFAGGVRNVAPGFVSKTPAVSPERTYAALRCYLGVDLVRVAKLAAFQRYTSCRIGIYRADVCSVPRVYFEFGGAVSDENPQHARDHGHCNGTDRSDNREYHPGICARGS